MRERTVPTKDDCKLIEWAIRERWPIPDAAREAMIAQLSAVVSEPGIIMKKPRLFQACAKTLLALSRTNLSVVDVALRCNAQEELEQRVAAIEDRAAEQERNGA